MNAPELAIIMPVCNEQASVRKVLTEWFHEIENWTESFVFLCIDDFLSALHAKFEITSVRRRIVVNISGHHFDGAVGDIIYETSIVRYHDNGARIVFQKFF